MYPQLNKTHYPFNIKPISQQSQNIVQPKTSKVPVPESSRSHDKLIPVPNSIIPQIRSGDDSNSRVVKRKNHTGY